MQRANLTDASMEVDAAAVAREHRIAWRIFVGAWFLGVALHCVFWTHINPFYMIFLKAAIFVMGGLIVLLNLLALRQRPLMRVGMIALVCIFAIGGHRCGPEIGIASRLYLNQRSYETVARAIIEGRADAPDGVAVDNSPPKRVAFPWDGLLSWAGVVYDPSGDIMREVSMTADDWTPPMCTLESVRHLWGPWYLCGFD